MAKVTQASYQAEIEKNLPPEVVGSDDNQSLAMPDVAPTRGSAVVEEEDVVDEDVGEQAEPEAEEAEPTYKKDQVKRIVQTRVQSVQKRLEKMRPYKEAVDRICEITGLDTENLIQRLSRMSVEEQAKILGVPAEQVNQNLRAKADMNRVATEKTKLERELEEQRLRTDSKYKDFDLYKDDVYDLLEEMPKLSLKQAYKLIKDEDDSVLEREVEQRTLAKVANSQSKRLVKPIGTVGNAGQKLSSDIVSAANTVKMNPVEYAAFRNISNIDSYLAYKNKK
jgi:hypothetical protein